MNRWLTNKLRFVLDECIPAIVRDSRWFMWPFYCVCYRGHNVRQMMDFKRNIYRWDQAELRHIYGTLRSLSRTRKTDLADSNVKLIVGLDYRNSHTLIDVGCGKGFLLEVLRAHYPHLTIQGCDIVNELQDPTIPFQEADLTRLPFADRQFDVVVCCHTLEHVPDVRAAVAELKRICNQRLIVVTPRQRYFYYTLDEHVNFFPFAETLTHLIGLPDYRCVMLDGDWVYVADLSTTGAENDAAARG